MFHFSNSGNGGVWPSGKAAVFGIAMRRFESFHPSFNNKDVEKGTGLMELTATKREEKAKKHRREQKIPCVLYGAKKPNENLLIERAEYEAILRNLSEGQILTTVFELKMESGSVRAIIKGIQYHRISYNVEHIDFLRLADDVKVKLKVPIRFIGSADCKGVKQGGVLKQAIRAVKVQCLPKDIPTELYVEVSDIGMLENKNLSHVKFPENVKPLISLKEVIATVAKR